MRHLTRSGSIILLAVLVLGMALSWAGHDARVPAVPGTGCGHLVAVLNMPGLGILRSHSSFLRVTARDGTLTSVVRAIFHPPQSLL